ncbi:hypothetical protein ANCCAN_07653 [Ancylostoma caninum]|uniref:Tc1-like transposase DDE domain-containing protein n=1 Tax=Ancylostoma caninum TaxID=29170 RepID=A0A368GSU4_ANCCA|nr:hypothetical protein ANCCAN_07653 [Ancylostoma caninum]
MRSRAYVLAHHSTCIGTEKLDAKKAFSDCVFTDESTVQIDCSTKFCYVKNGNHNPRLRSRAKHPAKLHIWGGISARGRTHLAILPGHVRINSRIYCNIIERCLLPFIRKVHNGFAQIVQDNAPAHTSRFTVEKFREWGLSSVEWPPESPDLNPIELVWGRMKTAIRSQRIRNLSDLKTAIKRNWNTLSPELCARYIGGIRKRMMLICEQNGGNIVE